MKTTINSDVHPSAQQHRNQRIRRRRKGQIRLFSVGAPLLALLLCFGWNALVPPSDSDHDDGPQPGNLVEYDVPAQSYNADTYTPPVVADDAGGVTQLDALPPQEEVPEVPAPPDDMPQGNVDDWNLILVNPWNSIPTGYEITLTQLKNGHAVDERCYPDLQDMMDDCRAAGLSPVICSSYRTGEKQERLFGNRVKSLMSQGYSESDAKTEAGKAIAVPGTSEHQLGLAVDIVDINNQNLDSSQEKTDVQKWLIKNSWKYGFILRYSSDKSDITGIMYEPWHYRYVGKEAAQYIYENNICLEEYLD